MKVGEYCRTDKGKIGKIVHFEPRDKYPYSYDRVILDTEGHKRTTRNIIKCSPNIINLIKNGDIVKYEIDDEEYISEVWGEKNDYFVQNFDVPDVPIDLRDLNIVSIITKEQIESMEYKVKE